MNCSDCSDLAQRIRYFVIKNGNGFFDKDIIDQLIEKHIRIRRKDGSHRERVDNSSNELRDGNRRLLVPASDMKGLQSENNKEKITLSQKLAERYFARKDLLLDYLQTDMGNETVLNRLLVNHLPGIEKFLTENTPVDLGLFKDEATNLIIQFMEYELKVIETIEELGGAELIKRKMARNKSDYSMPRMNAGNNILEWIEDPILRQECDSLLMSTILFLLKYEKMIEP